MDDLSPSEQAEYNRQVRDEGHPTYEVDGKEFAIIDGHLFVKLDP